MGPGQSGHPKDYGGHFPDLELLAGMSRFLSVHGVVSVDAMTRTERDSTAFTLVRQVICCKKKNTDQSASSASLTRRLCIGQRSHKTKLSNYNRNILVMDQHLTSYCVTALNLKKKENVPGLFFLVYFFVLSNMDHLS